MTLSFGRERPVDDTEQDRHEARDEPQRDADRLLYSSAYRRLKGVTQVISPQDEYVFHDRLMHSEKVAQVAHRLAQGLAASSVAGAPVPNPGVAFAAARAHDLGHPPFGHAGEQELQRVLEGRTNRAGEGHAGHPLLRDSFEGNAQSFRIVTTTSFRKRGEQAGLNLTWATQAAILKYPWARGEQPEGSPKLARKWAIYDSEREYASAARAWAVANDKWRSRCIEAEVMDWADDIAYAVHDVEDFYRSGVVPLSRLKHVAAEWKRFSDYAEDKLKSRESDDVEWDATAFAAIRGRIRPLLPDDVYDGSRGNRYDLHNFASRTIEFLTRSATLSPQGLRVDNAARLQAEFLKKLTQYYVLERPGLALMQIGQRRVLRELFFDVHRLVCDTYLQGDRSLGSIPARLRDYCDIALQYERMKVYGTSEAKLARATTDFLVSLTDTQAGHLHRRLTGDPGASAPEYWLTV